MRFAGIQLSNYLDPMNFDGISTASMEGRAKERMYDSQADYLVDKAGIDGDSLIKQAKYGASATRAQGSAAGSSAMFGGLASGVGSLAGGFANMGGSGGGGGLGVNSPAGDAQVMGMSKFDSNYIQTPGNFIETDITGSGIGLPKYGSW